MAAVFRAQFVYEAQQDDELTLQPGDQVHVLKNDNDDWWTVENVETGKKGLVPTNFLQPVSSTNGSGKKKNEAPILAKVINEYQPQNSDELALWVNGIVTVLDQSVGEGWWKGDLNGKVGIFPSNHVKLVDEAESADTATADTKPSKSPFKLAAYGVKQGGIGSILAGGMHLRKKSGGPSRTSIAEEEHQPHAAPPPILQEQKPTTSSDNKPTSSETTTHKKGMVVHDYEPENADELKLMRGEYVTITDKMDDDGWWAGTNETGLSGVFPSNFVQVLEDQRPPPRRTRPPTIKTDTSTTANPSNNENPLSPNSMAKPPPVPVSTRPTTLITNRTSEASSHSNTAPTPAARPVTSPPLPTRRPPSSAGSGPEPPKRTHKPRQPSIPLVSPDLPPITSKSHERPTSSTTDQTAPTRPSRPVPSPVDGGNTTSPRSSTVERRSVDINDHNRPPMPMAKPPKVTKNV
ncbi:SH3 domain-containing protein [Phascolomyces articulosus]|uniref:SH3 domain-containing protein n=1 Tax=Phascolomyces articulosus TaxID=60185 RepID=A0AAD5PH26_9FUNG|nr:SH3 domain-containing protein [Phascolomyces articulosus]